MCPAPAVSGIDLQAMPPALLAELHGAGDLPAGLAALLAPAAPLANGWAALPAAAAAAPNMLPPDGAAGPSNSHLLVTRHANVRACVAADTADNPAAGLSEVLDEMLFRYDPDLEALVVGYSNVTARPRPASGGPPRVLMMRTEPRVLVDGAADLLMYELRPGDVVCGYAHQLSAAGLAVVVMGAISTVIPASCLDDDMVWDAQVRCWLPAADRAAGEYGRAIFHGDIVSCLVLQRPVPQATGPKRDMHYAMVGSLVSAVPGVGRHEYQPPSQAEVRRLALERAAAQRASGGGADDDEEEEAEEQRGGQAAAAAGAGQPVDLQQLLASSSADDEQVDQQQPQQPRRKEEKRAKKEKKQKRKDRQADDEHSVKKKHKNHKKAKQ